MISLLVTKQDDAGGTNNGTQGVQGDASRGLIRVEISPN